MCGFFDTAGRWADFLTPLAVGVNGHIPVSTVAAMLSEATVDRLVLDLRDLTPIVTDNDDGDLVLQVVDGVSLVEFSAGSTGCVEQAILGAQRLATAATRMADELRKEAGQRVGAR
jgi:hypothetical protein